MIYIRQQCRRETDYGFRALRRLRRMGASPTAARRLGEGYAERWPFYGRSATARSEGPPVWVLDQV